MPVEFLTAEQEARYGQFADPPTPDQLAHYFWLDDADKTLVGRYRGAHNRLGFAVQLGTVRFLGTFVPDLQTIPANVIQYMAHQLNLDAAALLRYDDGDRRWDHTRDIRQAYGYRDFSDPSRHWRFVRWLYARAWLHPERPSVLFDQATAYLVEHKIVLPGVTTLVRQVAQVRDRAQIRLWTRLAAWPTGDQRVALEALLVPDPASHQTGLDRLRHPSIRVSITGLLATCDRLEQIRALGSAAWPLTGIPQRRLKTLARYAATARAQAVSQLTALRRRATLVAFAVVFAHSAQDDLVDLLIRWLMDLFARSDRQGQRHRLRTLKDLDGAARQLRQACTVLLDETTTDADVRATIFAQIPKTTVQQAIRQVDALTAEPDTSMALQDLFRHYGTIRRVLPRLWTLLPLHATPAGQPILDAWHFVRDHDGQARRKWEGAPTTGLKAPWRAAVVSNQGQVHPRAYTLWTVSQLIDGLRHHDLYLSQSERYGDPRAQLLEGEGWQTVRSHVLRTLNWAPQADDALKPLATALDTAYRQTAARWEDNAAVRLVYFVKRDSGKTALNFQSTVGNFLFERCFEFVRGRRLPRVPLGSRGYRWWDRRRRQ